MNLIDPRRTDGSLAAPQPAAQATATTSAQVLDPAALQRLRELDPRGEARVVPRVLTAYEASLSRVIEELQAARAAGRVEHVGRIAHTLKSSSASVGASRLSDLCAAVERGARQQHGDVLGATVEALVHEAQAVRVAVRAMLAD